MKSKIFRTPHSALRTLASLLLCVSALNLSAQTNPPVAPPAPPAPFAQATNQSNALTPFNAVLSILPSWDATLTNSFASGEFTIESAPLWKTMTASGTTPYNSTEADYFFTRNFGAGGELITLGSGAGNNTIDTANLTFTARKDVGNIAGYLLGNVGEDFNQHRIEGGFGPGLVYQYQTHIRLFLDTRFEYEGKKTATQSGSGFLTRIGMQIPF